MCNQLHVALEYINCMLQTILFPTLIYFKYCIFIPVKYASTFISFDSFRHLPQYRNDLNNTLILANLNYYGHFLVEEVHSFVLKLIEFTSVLFPTVPTKVSGFAVKTWLNILLN